ncbi:hypothetical protein RB195_001778 [Necator americanus]|uniref:Uncharacterized protein n=1 Tax=Necator americanus TaxID=51031 RepID=A0ABR1DG87_NECAM
MEIVVEDDVENEEEVGRSSTDLEDCHRDIFQRMEMEYASARESLFKVMRNPTEGTRMGNVEESENNVRLARRPEVPPIGCPQTLTPIRKLHKRAHLRKEEQAKRKPTLDIPDCAQDERGACAVCLRMQPNTNSTHNQISWMHTECISNVCPREIVPTWKGMMCRMTEM